MSVDLNELGDGTRLVAVVGRRGRTWCGEEKAVLSQDIVAETEAKV